VRVKVAVGVDVSVGVKVAVSVGMRVGTTAPTSVALGAVGEAEGGLGWQAANAIITMPHAALMI
jgi:hypothetical protein